MSQQHRRLALSVAMAVLVWAGPSSCFSSVQLRTTHPVTTVWPTNNDMGCWQQQQPASSTRSPGLSMAIEHTVLDDMATCLTCTTSSTGTVAMSMGWMGWYMKLLAAHPLLTKMGTGAILAGTGDFIAQHATAATSTTNDNNNDDDTDETDATYDAKRGLAFMAFDSAYRASQHALYPLVVQYCQGQTIGGLLPQHNPQAVAWSAALEQTLVSQLVIVPLLYYPVFYTVTGVVQGLTVEQTVERAKQTFLPLMRRNLLFWIPVQFVQFSTIPEDLQIPFLSVGGLCWTLILSLMAGSAKDYGSNKPTADDAEEQQQQHIAEKGEEPAVVFSMTTSTDAADSTLQEQDEPYCVTGMEEGCIISHDELFPDTTLEDMGHELEDISQDVLHEMEDFSHDVLSVVLPGMDDDDNDDDDNPSAGSKTREKELATMS